MRTSLVLLSSACLVALTIPPADAATTVGVAAAVNPAADATPPGGTIRSITLGDNVIHNERIATGPGGLVQILLVDGTTFTVGQNSDLTIDSFVYDPDAGTAQVAATFAKGALRFIGGRTSKTGGASIVTPVGTVGVRGGMTDVILGQTNSDLPPNLVNCVYGTCSLGGTTFEAGQSAYPGPDGTVTVVATTPAMAAAGTNEVGSTTGNGGANKSEEVASKSESAPVASDQTPPPTGGYDADLSTPAASGQNAGDEVVQDSGQGAPPPVVTPPFVSQPAGSINLRVLTAPDVYQTAWGDQIPETGNPGDTRVPASLGLVGNPGHDQTVTLNLFTTTNPQLFVGNGSITEGPQTGALQLPAYQDATFTTHAITGASSPFGPLAGTAYSNDDFTFYALSYLDTVARPFYALTGTPTDFPTAFTGNSVRHYALTQDPIQGLPVPFVQAGLINSFAGAAISDAAVIESPDISDPDSQHVRLLQTWLQISGTGLSQQSAVGVNAGDFFSEDGSDYAFRSGRRGSYRSAASDAATLFYGALNSVAGPGGGTEVFGPNGSNFVLSSDIGGNDPFGDVSLTGGSNFSTVAVLNMTGETAQSAQQSDHELFGFSAGMVEERASGYGGINAAAMLSAVDSSGFRIAFNAASNRLGGDLTVADAFDASTSQSLRLSFGGSFDLGGGFPGSGTYIDDDNFAAGTQGPDIGSDTPDPSDDRFTHSFATEDGGNTLVYQNGEFPVTYMVSANAVNLGPSPTFMGGATICTCSFIEWGWWGGQPRLATSANPDEQVLAQSIHLGTWVAGDIVGSFGDLPAVGTATYSGHVIGTVLAVNANDLDPDNPILSQYVAGGSVNMTWNFGASRGDIAMLFDGKSVGGAMLPAGSSGALFAGDIYGSGLQGSVNGAIVSNLTNTPVLLNAGIIGNFGLYGTNYAATGTIVGQAGGPGAAAPGPVPTPLRVLSAGETFTPYFNQENPIDDPGAVGLVGNGAGPGETGHDQTVSASLDVQDELLTWTFDGETLELPFELTSTSFSQHVNETAGALTVDGTAYFGAGRFAAYMLDAGSDGPLYAVTGIPTTITPDGGTGVFEGGSVRVYTLSEDVVHGIPVPFMSRTYFDDVGLSEIFDWDGIETGGDYASTPLYVVNEHDPESGFSPHVLQAWMVISGTGASQVSGIGVTAATIFNDPSDGNGFEISAGRRGSLRADAFHGSVTMGGAVSTMSTVSGANQFFGPNAENFVIGAGGFSNGDGVTNQPDAFGGWSLDEDAPGQGQYGTVHVATLTDEGDTGVTRTARNLSGFAAGMVDAARETGCSAPGVDCTDRTTDQTLVTGNVTTLRFSPANDRMGANIVVSGQLFGASPDSLQMEFGRNPGQDTGEGKSTFVNDDIYAARESGVPENTNAMINGATIHQRSGEQANSYLVSADAVKIENPEFMGGASCEDCGFMEWGWWGSTARYQDSGNPNDSVYVTSHLGTWVAGERPDPAALDDLAETENESASYHGQAVGNVSSAGASYIAGGDMDMNWNFGLRSGDWNVTNFDGHEFGGDIADPAGPVVPGVPGTGGFNGDLSVVGSGDSFGSVSGAFATDGANPAAGVMGNFGVHDVSGDWSAAGTFMGAATGLSEN